MAASVELLDSIRDVPADDWDRMIDPLDGSPFMEWRFLRSLEEADTVEASTGWIPRYVVVQRANRVIAACPAYLKLHSQGEFVFDFAWADLARRLGIDYYPKLLVGVPFTPVTGPRLLVSPDEDPVALRRALAQVLVEMCQSMELSSVHVNFTSEAEVSALEEVGFHGRLGIQYHWRRHGESSFDDYLHRFKSKKRNQLKRELREPEKQGIRIDTLEGEQLKGTASLAYRLYRSTVDKFFWGQRYLTPKVFEIWTERMADRMRLVVARQADGEPVAGAVNFEKGRRLYGRYWGCFRELRHLHFNVCYYHGVQQCYARGLDVFEPGAGGDHKLVRGFEPTLMRSAHYVRDRRFSELLGPYLERERQAVVQEQAALQQELGTKAVSPPSSTA